MGAVMPAFIMIISYYEQIWLRMNIVNKGFRILENRKQTAFPFKSGRRITQPDLAKTELLMSSRVFRKTYKFLLATCLPVRLRAALKITRSDEILYEKGPKKLSDSLDVVQLLGIQKRLAILEKTLFNRKQL